MTLGPFRRALLLLLIAALAPLFIARTETSAQQEPNGPIAATALKYLDTYGGQCWTFMANVVQEATGRTIGYGYRDGYFAAGAVEVSASEARNGDIIQIASDTAGPFAYYPGLHTAIILENLGGGVFNAIDSNQNWDEWVRMRPNYDPYAAAARYGLQVHIYRIPGGGPGDSGASLGTTTPASWAAGTNAVVSTSGCLNLRAEPSLSASRVGCLPTGAGVNVTGDAVVADGYTWVPVQTTAGPGWMAADYLSQTSEPVVVEAAAPPAPTPTPAPEPVAAAPAASGTLAHTDSSPGCLRVRSSAGIAGDIIDCLAANTAVSVLADASVSLDGYSWVKVQVNGKTGWVASEFLVY